MTCWITTHWPVPATVPPFSRHVYVKKSWRLRRMPEEGDTILVYEARTATVDHQRVREARLWVRRSPTGLAIGIPDGLGGAIGRMIVNGKKRDICDDDVVLDYGNLRNEEGFLWQVIPCDKWQPVRRLMKGDLMEAVGEPHNRPPMFLNLWRVPGQFVATLLDKLGC